MSQAKRKRKRKRKRKKGENLQGTLGERCLRREV
jgi:hypothetical protein